MPLFIWFKCGSVEAGVRPSLWYRCNCLRTGIQKEIVVEDIDLPELLSKSGEGGRTSTVAEVYTSSVARWPACWIGSG